MSRGLGPERNRLCRLSFPAIPLLKGRKRQLGVYAAGALFAAGWWFFFSAAILSAKAGTGPDASAPPTHVRFTDWLPGLFATLGMIIVNLLDKESLTGIDGGFDNLAWRARLFLFFGFALLAGGLAGSMSVLVLKYLVPQYADKQVIYWGLANVIQNICIMLSACFLWLAQNVDEEYEYSLNI